MSDKPKKEASMAPGVKGAVAPMGLKVIRKAENMKPYGGPDLFVHALEALNDEEFEEVVRPRGDEWVYYDDDTGAQKAVNKDRHQVWKIQRRDRDARKKAHK